MRAGVLMDSAASLLGVLRDRGLLPPEQIDEIDPTRYPDPKALARDLIQRGWLTPYQVNQVFQGRAADLTLGPYVILERIGEGGMGQVFKARQERLDRVVALKVIRQERLANPSAARRFTREVKAVAALSHPNIVLAFDADHAGSSHFLVMEFVSGIDLGKLVQRDGPLPVALACSAIRQAALGLQHVHERGLVHRDIKPSNLMLADERNSKAPPTVKILDLGLTRLHADDSESSSTLTQEGSVMGTPDFIAPEQALNSHLVDIRADLYSLGCTFHYLLTGQVPFPGGTALEKLLKHRLEEVRPVEKLRPDVPPGVAAIVRKLMAKRPEDRFQTPAELADALLPFTGDNATTWQSAPALATPVNGPTIATPAIGPTVTQETPLISVQRRQREEQRRMRRITLISGALLAASLLLVIGLLVSQRKSSRPAVSSAIQANADPVTLALQGLQRQAEEPHADYDPLRMAILDFRSRHPGTSQAQQAAALMMRLPSSLDSLNLDDRVIRDRLLTALPKMPRELVGVLGRFRKPGVDEPYWAVAISPDCNWVAGGGKGGDIGLFDVRSPRLGPRFALELPVAEPVKSLAFSPDGRYLASAGEDQPIRLWEYKGRNPTAPVGSLDGHSGVIWAIAFSPDGRTLASASNDHTIKLWDVSTRTEMRTLTGHTEGVTAVAFSPDGKTLASGGRDNTVRLWDADNGTELATLGHHNGLVWSVAFRPDGLFLASGGDHSVKLWNLGTRTLERTFDQGGLFDQVTSVAFSPDGRELASLSLNFHLIRWDVTSGRKRSDWQVLGASNGLAYAADGRHLAVASHGHVVFILRIGETMNDE